MLASIQRSEVLQIAHDLTKTSDINFGEAQEQAWKIAKARRIKNALLNGIVFFTYETADGRERQAVGTLHPQLYYYRYKTNARPWNDDITFGSVVRYFDLGINRFRSFRVDRVKEIYQVHPVRSGRAILAQSA